MKKTTRKTTTRQAAAKKAAAKKAAVKKATPKKRKAAVKKAATERPFKFMDKDFKNITLVEMSANEMALVCNALDAFQNGETFRSMNPDNQELLKRLLKDFKSQKSK